MLLAHRFPGVLELLGTFHLQSLRYVLLYQTDDLLLLLLTQGSLMSHFILRFDGILRPLRIVFRWL